MAIRATVVAAKLRRSGTNQTEVPRKNTAKKRTTAAMLAASAARTPSATNGGQRLTPVRKPNAAAPGIWCFLVPMVTSSGIREDSCHKRREIANIQAQTCPLGR
jgi:hypothetical protein